MINCFYRLQKVTSNNRKEKNCSQRFNEKSHNCHSSVPPVNHVDTKADSNSVSKSVMSADDPQPSVRSSCIIKIESSANERATRSMSGDYIQQILVKDADSSLIYPNSSSSIRLTQLDAIEEDSNEENFDQPDKMTMGVVR